MTAFAQRLGRVQHRVMLDGARDDVRALEAPGQRSEECKIIGLGTAGREDDLLRSSAKRLRDTAAGSRQLARDVLPTCVHAGRVGRQSSEKRQHRIEHFWAHRRRGSVIEIQPFHDLSNLARGVDASLPTKCVQP